MAGGVERARRTTQAAANARPPTQEDIRHKVQTPVSADDAHKQMHALKKRSRRSEHPLHAHVHAHRRSDDTRLKTHGRDESIEDTVGEEGGGCLDVLQLPNSRQTH